MIKRGNSPSGIDYLKIISPEIEFWKLIRTSSEEIWVTVARASSPLTNTWTIGLYPRLCVIVTAFAFVKLWTWGREAAGAKYRAILGLLEYESNQSAWTALRCYVYRIHSILTAARFYLLFRSSCDPILIRSEDNAIRSGMAPVNLVLFASDCNCIRDTREMNLGCGLVCCESFHERRLISIS